MEGSKLTLYGAIGDGGTCDADVFLGKLDVRAQVKFQARFERLTEIGYLRSPDEMRNLQVPGQPDVHEIKVHYGPGYRLYIIRLGIDWMATHGCEKPKNRHVPAQAEKARDIAKAAKT